MKRNITIALILVTMASAFTSCSGAYLGVWSYVGSTDDQDRWIEFTEEGEFNYVIMEAPNFTDVEYYYYGTYTVSKKVITLECEKVSDGSQSEEDDDINLYEWTETDEEIEITYAKSGSNLVLTFEDGSEITLTEAEDNVFSDTRSIAEFFGI
ncbi:MAG: hypothetical protein PQJ61_04605 [Spirochaetales bacterium]|uniref:Lipocalin-like domain-containing protein n=1 Tax=Candidatus Thalassospirochaeta sargassi TaxID=3119039 RepID=A0AAJ1IDX8_9SPIO|nr:hypothetical protein [Spirochaetales bacterium]